MKPEVGCDWPCRSFSEKKLPDLTSVALSSNLSSGSLGEEKGGEKGEEEGGEGERKSKPLTESLSASTSQQSVQSVTTANLMSIDLCRREQDDLLADLCDLPRKGADRKVGSMSSPSHLALPRGWSSQECCVFSFVTFPGDDRKVMRFPFRPQTKFNLSDSLAAVQTVYNLVICCAC